MSKASFPLAGLAIALAALPAWAEPSREPVRVEEPTRLTVEAPRSTVEMATEQPRPGKPTRRRFAHFVSSVFRSAVTPALGVVEAGLDIPNVVDPVREPASGSAR